eukprot:Phypoly_transcript_07273.p1 GENE.Phypoly_transcript_07273~~Phypoly_transcript_07273.p1  ORF type:complete len:521 (+),score=129.26 Phypoly_transcript_07273:29-1564(+)
MGKRKREQKALANKEKANTTTAQDQPTKPFPKKTKPSPKIENSSINEHKNEQKSTSAPNAPPLTSPKKQKFSANEKKDDQKSTPLPSLKNQNFSVNDTSTQNRKATPNVLAKKQKHSSSEKSTINEKSTSNGQKEKPSSNGKATPNDKPLVNENSALNTKPTNTTPNNKPHTESTGNNKKNNKPTESTKPNKEPTTGNKKTKKGKQANKTKTDTNEIIPLAAPLFPMGVPDLKSTPNKTKENKTKGQKNSAKEKEGKTKGQENKTKGQENKKAKTENKIKPDQVIPDLTKHTELQKNVEEKLKSSQFRYINEQLYTMTGQEAKEMYEKNPELPIVYHMGYRRQVAQWPLNPLTLIIERIKEMDPKLKVADFGCGEAMLAASVPNVVHSFDLHAANERVIECEMSHVPLENNSVDVVVFCLSLMGTNFKDYLIEANRVLSVGGILLIAEVKSRIDSLNDFIEFLKEAGFVYDKSNKRDKMFVWFEFHKSGRGFYSSKERAVALLKPCKYKKR